MYTVGASDADATDVVLTYSINGGNTANKFSLNSITGELTLQAELDRETTSVYSLELKVEDEHGRTATTSIIITVSDVNDNDPTCSPSSYTLEVAEDVSTVVTISCSDVDSSTPTVFYTLLSAGNTGTAFSIDFNTGYISVTGGIDYEAVTFYSLTG